MKSAVCFVLLMMLSGCAMPVWETVEDTHPVVPVASWQEEAYEIEIGVPSDLALQEESADWQLYATADGTFEVETRRFLASDLDDAVRTLSGYASDQLTILKTTRFDLPEYQFAWLALTEQGSRVYRAKLVMNELDCYAVVCSRAETAGTAYEEPMRQVFSTFGLYIDEGV